MFTGMIQNLLNTSGQQAAIQRMQQLNTVVQNRTMAPDFNEGQELKTFEDVMNSSLNVHTRFNVNKPQIDNSLKFGSLTTKQVEAIPLNPLQDDNSVKNIVPTDLSAMIPISGANINSKSQIKDMISQVSKKHGMDERLINAVIRQESGYNPNAESSAGAQGLMQLMPMTAKSLGVTDPFNPVQNVEGGVKYLKSMMERYNGNVILALAAYNAGPGNVDKYNGVPPFKETQNYVKNILENYL